MESGARSVLVNTRARRIQWSLIKTLVVSVAIGLSWCSQLLAETLESLESLNESVIPAKVRAEQSPVVDPEIERTPISESHIDSENFEIGVFVGVISIEDFGAANVMGARFALFATENAFLEAVYGISEAPSSAIEKVFPINLLDGQDRDYEYYNLSVGYNLLPGEAFLANRWAVNTAFYGVAGVGQTQFGGDSEFTLNLGVGIRLLFADSIAWHIDMRDHIFDTSISGADKITHNLEFHSGLTVFF